MVNHTEQYLNKQGILDRMQRFAANYFGVSQTELLDPVVRLFLESLGEEIYKISGEINNMEDRILNKLSSMLVFDTDAIAKPAHTILHASALETAFQITPETEFYYKRRTGKIKNRLSFYPVCNTRLYKGDIRYFIHKGLFYSIDREQKTLMTRSTQKETFSDNSFWLGLELDENIENIADLSFYVDFNNVYNKEAYLSQLPYTVWKIQDQIISMHKGLFSVNDEYDSKTLELFSSLNYSTKINRDIKNAYDAHYLSVKSDFDISDKRSKFPDKLNDYFPENFPDRFTESLLWVEVNCPSGFTPEIIDSMQISINAFPVVNKKIINRTVELNRAMPIIPLNTGDGESFISVHSVADSNGKLYYDFPLNHTEKSQYGIYSLRRGGYERYNVREAREYLVNTIDSLSSEVSAFFKNGDDIKADLKKIQLEVDQVIKNLRNIVTTSKEQYEIENYILITQKNDDHIFFVRYWVTDGGVATNIKTGTTIKPQSGLPINQASTMMLSSTKEGKYAPQQIARYKIYKKTLTKHNLIVTNKDIEKFCMEQFQDLISDVQIHKGLIEDSNQGIGFIKTTDVYLKSHKELEKHLDTQDVSFFEQTLSENSPITFRYRVFINKKLPN